MEHNKQESTWCKNINNINVDNKFKDWMQKPYILSKAMKKICDDLTVNIISQKNDLILESEANKVSSNLKQEYIRTVYITGNNDMWEYARVIIPKVTLNAYKDVFLSLGGKLIGESLLYGNPKTTRSNFEFTKLKQNDYIYQKIFNSLPYLKKVESIFGRRSLFMINNIHPLLISEFFLPDIPNYIE